MQKKEVTQEKYEYAFEVLPPIYVSHINGLTVQNGFAVIEPLTHANGVAVLSVYWLEDGKAFSTNATLKDKNGQRVFYPELFSYHTTKAFTHE